MENFKTRKKKKRAGRPIGSKGIKKRNFLKQVADCSPEKRALIKKIWKLEPEYKALEIDLTIHDVETLEKHIRWFKKKGKR